MVARIPSFKNETLPQGQVASGGTGVVRQPTISLDPAAEALKTAGQRIQLRDDAVNRAKAVTEFNEQAASEFERMRVERDFSSRETAQEYIQRLDKIKADALGKYRLSPDGAAQLDSTLEGLRGQYRRSAAQERLEAQKRVVNTALDQALSGMVASVYQDPDSIHDNLLDMNDVLSGYAGALTPDEEVAFRTVARNTMTVSAFESMMDSGDLDSAEALIASTPNEFLLPDSRLRLEQELRKARNDENAVAQRLSSQFKAMEGVLGRPLTRGERAIAMGIAAPQSAPAPTALMQNLAAAGLQPGTPEYRQAMIESVNKPNAQVNVNMPGEAPFGSAGLEDRVEKANEKAQNASQLNFMMERAGDLIASGASTGATAGSEVFLRNMAQSLGLPVDEKTLADQEEFRQLSNQVVLKLAENLSGVLSDRDMQVLRESSVDLGTSPEGNIRAIATMQAASSVAADNAKRLRLARNAEEASKIEMDIMEQEPQALMERRDEIATEIRARRAATTGALDPAATQGVTVDMVSSWTPEQAKKYIADVQAAGTGDMLPPDVITKLMAIVRGESPLSGRAAGGR